MIVSGNSALFDIPFAGQIEFLLFAGFFVLFVIAFIRNRYRFRTALLFLLTSFFFLITQITVFNGELKSIGQTAILLLVFLFFALVISFFLLLFSLFYNGIILLRKEGVSFTNLLSLFLLLYIFATPLIYAAVPLIRTSRILQIIVAVNAIFTAYLLFVSFVYVVGGILVILTSRRRPADYIIVLGCGLMDQRTVTPLLAGRIDKAIRLFQKAPERTFLVMSGGKGSDEAIPESCAMKEYAVSKGIPPERILTEEASINTMENMLFSKQLIDSHFTKEEKPAIAYATSRYHQFRAGAYAVKAGMNITGVGSSTKFYFEQNAVIREFIALLVQHKKIHGFVIVLLIMLAVAGQMILNGF